MSWFHLYHSSHFSIKGNYASSIRRANLFAISAIIITRATKFVAMLRTLNLITKIHTCGRIFFFSLGKICCRAGSKETFLKMGALSVKARAYPTKEKQAIWILKMPSYRCYSVSMEILSFPFLFARQFSRAFLSMRTHFAAVSTACKLWHLDI